MPSILLIRILNKNEGEVLAGTNLKNSESNNSIIIEKFFGKA